MDLSSYSCLYPHFHGDIGVYVHIPFCHYRCHYCDFYFQTAYNQHLVQRTLDKIIHHWQHFLSYTDPHNCFFPSLYIGGGTPSVLSYKQLNNFLNSFFSALPPSARSMEISIEANPEDISEAWLMSLNQWNVHRLSLGIQSFDDHLLNSMNRKCSAALNHQALEKIKTHFHGQLSCDLMIGFPQDSWERIDQDLALLFSYSVDHISLYELSIEQQTPLYQMVQNKTCEPLQESIKEQLWFKTHQKLIDHGYQPYELANYAKHPKAQCLHNKRYWQLRPYLGLGAGATSLLPFTVDPPAKLEAHWKLTDTHFNISHSTIALHLHNGRLQEPCWLDHLLKNKYLTTHLSLNASKEQNSNGTQNLSSWIEALDFQQLASEWIMMQVRLPKGLQLKQAQLYFGDHFRSWLESFLGSKKWSIQGNRARPDSKNAFQMNALCIDFIEALEQAKANPAWFSSAHSRKEPYYFWPNTNPL